MKKILLCALFLLPQGLSAEKIDGLVKKYYESAGLKSSLWGVDLRYSDGKKIYSLNADKNLVPASILKVFVTAAALETLGPGYKFRTELYAGGGVRGGVLYGDLIIKGWGDMTLGSRNFDSSPEKVFGEWLSALKDRGIKEIKGDIKADDTLFADYQPGSWAWEDVANYYAARTGALSINDNLYRLFFKTGKAVGEKAEFLRFEPEMPLEIENQVVTGPEKSGDNSYIYGLPWYGKIVVKGSIQKQEKEFAVKGAMGDGALYCATAFGKYLTAAGIKAGGSGSRVYEKKDYKKFDLVYSSFSPELRDIIKVTNKKSFNFYAETLLRMLPFGENGLSGEKEGFSELRKFLAKCGIEAEDLRLEDSSGLSRVNSAKPSDFTKVLNFMAGRASFQFFYESMAYPGDPEASGHIKNMGLGRNFEKSLRIKSGSLTGVRSYSGYLRTKKGRLVSFSSIINNYSLPSAELDRIHEEIFSLLYENY